METRGKSQKYLAMMWALQNNQSNAVATPKGLAREHFPYRVYRAWIGSGQWLYAVEPIRMDEGGNTERKKAGRPKVLTEGQRQQLREWHTEGVSNREIARKFRVSEGTIRNFLREKSAESNEGQKSP